MSFSAKHTTVNARRGSRGCDERVAPTLQRVFVQAVLLQGALCSRAKAGTLLLQPRQGRSVRWYTCRFAYTHFQVYMHMEQEVSKANRERWSLTAGNSLQTGLPTTATVCRLR